MAKLVSILGWGAAMIAVPAACAGAAMLAGIASETAPAPATVAAVPEPEPSPVSTPKLAPAPSPRPQPPKAEPFVIKRVLDVGGPIRFGDYFWEDKDVPPGRVVITVDLEAQTLSVFRGGIEIGATAILYGADEKPTPLGAFTITQKKKHHVSNLYGAPMPYMQRLTNDGVAIHGSDVEEGYATHGCIGVPTAFAKLLFGVTRMGDTVIITKGKRIGVGSKVIG